MKKLIASDFDGTLNRRGGISQEDKDAIKHFRAAGGLFGIVTGRDRAGSYDVFDAGNMFEFDYVLALNGAYAIDHASGETLYALKISSDTLLPDGTPLLPTVIDDICRWTGHHVGMAFEDGRADFRAHDRDGTNGSSPYSDMFSRKAFIQLNTIADTDETVRKTIELTKEKYGSIFSPLQNGHCIDIPPLGMNKGVGVARFAEMKNIPHNNIWTVGDNFNDMDMIIPFHGCAMENGVGELKEKAEHVVKTIAEVVELAMASD